MKDLPLPITKLGKSTSPHYTGFSEWAISAMKLAGMVFTHGRCTTRQSVLNFVARHPHFRASDFYGKNRLAAPELAAKYPECSADFLQRLMAGRTASRHATPQVPCKQVQ